MISKEREVRVYVNRSRGLLLARQTLKGFVWSSTNSTSLGVGKGKIRCPKGIYERVLRIFRSNRFAPIYNRVVGSIQCEKGGCVRCQGTCIQFLVRTRGLMTIQVIRRITRSSAAELQHFRLADSGRFLRPEAPVLHNSLEQS